MLAVCICAHLAVLARYITDEDLEFYKERVERDLELPGGCWQHMMDKNLGDMRYSAWKRPLAVCLLGSILSATC